MSLIPTAHSNGTQPDRESEWKLDRLGKNDKRITKHDFLVTSHWSYFCCRFPTPVLGFEMTSVDEQLFLDDQGRVVASKGLAVPPPWEVSPSSTYPGVLSCGYCGTVAIVII
jgi:hypothetical protein